MPRAKKGQQKVYIFKKTTALCWSVSLISLGHVKLIRLLCRRPFKNGLQFSKAFVLAGLVQGLLCSHKNTVLNVFFILCKQSYASISDGVCNTMEHDLKFDFIATFNLFL